VKEKRPGECCDFLQTR